MGEYNKCNYCGLKNILRLLCTYCPQGIIKKFFKPKEHLFALTYVEASEKIH